MRLAGLDGGQRQRVADLSLRKALAAIAEPAVAKSRDELLALPQEELDRQRLAGLTQAVEISEEILAEDAFKNLTSEQRKYALRTTEECEEMLIELAARSPNAKHLYAALYARHNYAAIAAELRKAGFTP